MADTISTISNAANAEYQRLQGLERDLTQEINTLLDVEWTRKLTAAEAKNVVELREAKAAVFSAMEELSYVTLAALDKSQEVVRIRNALERVRRDLDRELADVKGIGKIASKVPKILDGVEKVVTKLDSLSAKFGKRDA